MKYLFAALAVTIIIGASGYLFFGEKAASMELNGETQPLEQDNESLSMQAFLDIDETYDEHEYSDLKRRAQARLRVLKNLEIKQEETLLHIKESDRETQARKDRAQAISEWLNK